MEKIQLVVQGLSASPASNNAYALILKEMNGSRRLPIIIGAFEAQAIALEMEGVVPPRPMTHDLFRAVIDSFDSVLSEVYINELRDGTFYAKLIFESPNIEIDSRPSDAIAIAVRCTVPIFVNSEILNETGMMSQENDYDDSDIEDENFGFMKGQKETEKKRHQPLTKIEQLQSMLDKAIKDEEYEKAASIRDEIKKFLEAS